MLMSANLVKEKKKMSVLILTQEPYSLINRISSPKIMHEFALFKAMLKCSNQI